MPQRVDGDVALGSLPALGPFVPGSAPALRRALSRAAVNYYSGGLLLPVLGCPQELPQALSDASFDPALDLLVDVCPRRQARYGSVAGERRNA